MTRRSAIRPRRSSAEANFHLDRIIAAARGVPANDPFDLFAIDRAVAQIAAAERILVADTLATGQSDQRAAENWLAAHPKATRIRRSLKEIATSGLTN
jgi:glutamate dehydrogenase